MKPALVVFIMIIFLVQFLSIHSITLKTRQNFQWGLKSKFNKSLYQSPINIISNSSIITYVKPILMYHPANSSSLYLDPQDNTVKLKAASFGKLVTINNMIFNAEEIQFHTPEGALINDRTHKDYEKRRLFAKNTPQYQKLLKRQFAMISDLETPRNVKIMQTFNHQTNKKAA